MSRRTAPVFSESRNTFLSSNRHVFGYLKPHRTGGSTSQAGQVAKEKDAVTRLYEALDEPRFDQVRRAVYDDRTCLRRTKKYKTSNSPALSPVSYALANCEAWQAVAAHCIRTGIALEPLGGCTFRERIFAMNAIISWLLQQPEVEIPEGRPLHLALACGLDQAAMMMCRRAPWLTRTTDSRGKTALHILCGLPSGIKAADAARMVCTFAHSGADCTAPDLEGATPLHDLIKVSATPVSFHGLTCRRRCVNGIEYVRPVLDTLLAHGARLDARDNSGRCPVDLALHEGLDYIGLMRRAALLRECLVRNDDMIEEKRDVQLGVVGEADCAKKKDVVVCEPRPTGVFGLLPDDAVIKIMSFLTPCDIVRGIAETCQSLRRVASSNDLWKHLEITYCLNVVRASVLNAQRCTASI